MSIDYRSFSIDGKKPEGQPIQMSDSKAYPPGPLSHWPHEPIIDWNRESRHPRWSIIARNTAKRLAREDAAGWPVRDSLVADVDES